MIIIIIESVYNVIASYNYKKVVINNNNNNNICVLYCCMLIIDLIALELVLLAIVPYLCMQLVSIIILFLL